MQPPLPAELLAAVRTRSKGNQPCDFALPNARRPARPLSGRSLTKIEKQLRFALPLALREVYGAVGNGGFGPGYGLIGLSGGVKDDLGRDVVEDYALRRQRDPEDAAWFWPTGVLAVCHWGCAVYSCIDCRTDQGRVLRFDPNPVDGDWLVAWGLEKQDLRSWLSSWVNGEELFESGTPDGTFAIDR